MAEKQKTDRRRHSPAKRIAALLLCAAMLVAAVCEYVPVQAENEKAKEIVSWSWEESEQTPVREEKSAGWELKLDTGEKDETVTREELEKLLPSEIRAEVRSSARQNTEEADTSPQPTGTEPQEASGEIQTGEAEEEIAADSRTAKLLTPQEVPEPDEEKTEPTPDAQEPGDVQEPGEEFPSPTPEETPEEAEPTPDVTPEPEETEPIPEATPTPDVQEPGESPGAPTPAGEAEEKTESRNLSLRWDVSSYPEEGAQTGEYTVSASIPDGYTLPDGSRTLNVTVVLADEPDASKELLAQHVVKADEQPGTTINVFDYWLHEQGDSDAKRAADDPDFYKCGINANHNLLFGKDMSDVSEVGATLDNSNNKPGQGGKDWNSAGRWNAWSYSGGGPVNGIVQSTLENGYPKLNLNDPVKGWKNPTKLQGRPREESLNYLFDVNVPHDGKESYADVSGLLQIDNDGYFYYNSQRNFASLKDGDYKNFVLYDSGAVNESGSSPYGQFFPFNSGAEVFGNKLNDEEKLQGKESLDSKSGIVNHYFGMHMRTSFYQDYDGYTSDDKDKPVTYTFAGDDDVWIFIDDVLVADLGGIHDAVKVAIDFSTGEIKIESASTVPEAQRFKAYESTIKNKFTAAGQGDKFDWNENTFPDRTHHTLDFFYLERGNSDSNIDLRFNLLTIPESSVIKVDQMGNKLPNVQFKLYAAYLGDDGTYIANENQLIASGTTETDGSFVFKDIDNPNKNLSLDELFGDYKGETGTAYFVLREENLPDGYRSAGDVWIRLEEHNGNVVLLGSNPWDTGAYASAGVYVTVPGNTVCTRKGKEYSLEENGEPNGTLFAVPIKLEREESSGSIDGYQGYVITGDMTTGWKTHKDEGTGLDAILNILKENRDSYYTFKKSPNGLYATTINDLPGDITEYYYMMSEGEKDRANYSIAYYYTTASRVENATVKNTWLVQSDPLKRVFSTNIYVPNIKNYLLVQKLDEKGNPLTGAEFSLYKSENVTDTEDGLQIPEETGPFMTGTTNNYSKEDGASIDLQGGIIFGEDGVLLRGTYYLVETRAPDGYEKIENYIRVVVANTGVYADAGAEDDGVTVQRGMGSIVKSMLQFTADDDVDVTLNQIMARFYTAVSEELAFCPDEFENFTWRNWNSESEEFQATENAQYIPAYIKNDDGKYRRYDPQADAGSGNKTSPMHTKYEGSTAVLEYGIGPVFEDQLDSAEEGVIAQETDTGWSYLMMEQCQEHIKSLSGPYTKLKGIDLTNLFSGTVLVKVTNQKTAELSIGKNLSYGEEITTPDEKFADISFTFELTLKEADQMAPGRELAGSYPYSVTCGEETKESGILILEKRTGETTQVISNGELKESAAEYVISGVTVSTPGSETSSYIKPDGSGTYQIHLKPGEVLKISALPDGTKYTVTEKETDGFRLFGVAVGDKPAEVSDENQVSGEISDTTNVVFTNMPEGSITITKRDGAGEALIGAAFALYDYQENGNYDMEKPVSGLSEVSWKKRTTIEQGSPGYDEDRGRITVDGDTYIVHKGENGELYYYQPCEAGESGAEAVVEFSGLDITKRYAIVETTTPAGYETIDPITTVQTEDSEGMQGIKLPLEKDNSLIYDITLSVTNRKGVILPSAGQFGPLIYIMLGADLAGGGATYLLWQKKRKQRMRKLKRYRMR